MVPYVNMDVTVHHPPPLSVAMFHRCCIMGENNTSASSCARTTECTHALKSTKYQRISIAAILGDICGVSLGCDRKY